MDDFECVSCGGETILVDETHDRVCVVCGELNAVTTAVHEPPHKLAAPEVLAEVPATVKPPRKRAAKPAASAPKLVDTSHEDLRGDRYGRYTLVTPDGKRVTASRASTVNQALSDTYNLNQWKQACVLRGAATRPGLSTLAASLDPKNFRDKARLRELVVEAEEAGGSKASAELGTLMHGWCEAIDTGVPNAFAAVPKAYRKDVAAYVAALHHAGITVLPDMVERTTMTSRWGRVGGTFDNIVRLADGRHTIADKKTGKVGYDPAEMFGQLVVYVEGVRENGVYDRPDASGRYPGTWTRPDFVLDPDLALIVHIPVGQGLCVLYEADMNVGRTHMDRCERVRKERKDKHYLRAYMPPNDFDPPHDGARVRWADELHAVADKASASMVWQIMSAMRLVDDDVKSLAAEVATRLKGA